VVRGRKEILICSWSGKERRRKMAAQEQEHEKQQAKTSTTSSLPSSSSERSSSSAPNNLREGGRCRAQPMHHPLRFPASFIVFGFVS